jgi:ABC-type sugar transport system permease subunit
MSIMQHETSPRSAAAWWRTLPVIVVAAIVCIAPVVYLFATAFTAAPECEKAGDDDMQSELVQTIVAFTAGWAFSYAMKMRNRITL